MWSRALVYKGTLRFGAFFLSGCLVWCCGLVLGWPSWEPHSSPHPHPPPPSRPQSWGRCLELSATQRVSSHGGLGEALCRLLSFCSWRLAFHLSPLLLTSSFFFSSERCVCFNLSVSPQRSRFLYASPSDSGAEVMLFKDGLGWEFKDLYQASYLLLPDGLFIPHFLLSWSLFLIWAFPPFTVSYPQIHSAHWCHKELGCNKRINKPHNSRKCSDKCWLGYVGVPSTLIKLPFWKQPCYV